MACVVVEIKSRISFKLVISGLKLFRFLDFVEFMLHTGLNRLHCMLYF